ncbi:Smr/MutS family protein [Neisseriaceae bacterium TC5R-5]|nr:Smr/MutS family protein [Neisseriaceae bacterium TC5R-5]
MKAFKKVLKDIRQQVRPQRAPAAPMHNSPPPVVEEPDFPSLFRDATPLKPDQRYHAEPAKPKPRPRRQYGSPAPSSQADQTALLQHMIGWFEAPEIDLHFVRSGQATATLKKLRAGHWPISGQLDLHGYDRYQAQDALALFIHQARGNGPCVRIIHGKGFGSNGTPVLKRLVRSWLKHHPHVLAFCEASDKQGGSGALLVLLKRANAVE